jgi:hypothetical protein
MDQEMQNSLQRCRLFCVGLPQRSIISWEGCQYRIFQADKVEHDVELLGRPDEQLTFALHAFAASGSFSAGLPYGSVISLF